MVDLNDVSLAPRPEGGWSSQIRTVPDALVAPIEQGYLVHAAGVFDANGTYVPECVLWRGRPLLVAPPLPEVLHHLPGRWIWGGVLVGHFGHFLTESAGRLWALNAIRGLVDGIVFIAKRDVGASELTSFHKAFFELLGLRVPVRVIAQPTRIDLLEVPGQGFGIGPLAGGTDQFRSFIHSRFGTNVAPSGGERLYISRSELSVQLGGILDEVRLERHLADCGYEIIHPQNHSMREQVARYKAAKHVVSLDGSALHLFAMVAGPDQQVAIVRRRNSNGTDSLVRHLSAFVRRDPLILDVVRQNWVRSDRPRPDNFSFGELDFAALGQELAKAGFIPGDVVWSSLSPEGAAAAIKRIEQQLARKRLTFRAVPRQIIAPDAPPREDKESQLARRAERRLRKAAALRD